MTSSGNGPTVIDVMPDRHDDETIGDVVDQADTNVVKNALHTLFGKPSRKPGISARPSFESKLPVWALESKPVKDPLQYVLWWLYVRLRLYRTKLQPPKEVSYFRVRLVTDAVISFVNNAREETAAIIAVMAIKGGVGKTTIATWLSVTIAFATKLSLAIIDTDRGGGLVPARLGLNKTQLQSTGAIKRPLSFKELGDRIQAGEVFSPQKLMEETVSDPETGIMVFSAPAGRGLSMTHTRNTLRSVRSLFAGGITVDTTPGLRVPMSNAAAVTSDVKIIVAQGISDESIMGVRTALNFEPYELRGSIDSVLVVIVALPDRKCSRRTAHELAERFNLQPAGNSDGESDGSGDASDDEADMSMVTATEQIQPSQVLFLPIDRYMDTHRVDELKHVKFEAARPRTKLALALLAKAKGDIVLRHKVANATSFATDDCAST